jgi:hypothetical protein
MIAEVAGFTLNDSATNLITAVKGAFSGTERLLINNICLRFEGQFGVRRICNFKADFLHYLLVYHFRNNNNELPI